MQNEVRREGDLSKVRQGEGRAWNCSLTVKVLGTEREDHLKITLKGLSSTTDQFAALPHPVGGCDAVMVHEPYCVSWEFA